MGGANIIKLKSKFKRTHTHTHRWVKTNMIELESLCRGKDTLKFKDPEQKGRYRGELVRAQTPNPT